MVTTWLWESDAQNANVLQRNVAKVDTIRTLYTVHLENFFRSKVGTLTLEV